MNDYSTSEVAFVSWKADLGIHRTRCHALAILTHCRMHLHLPAWQVALLSVTAVS